MVHVMTNCIDHGLTDLGRHCLHSFLSNILNFYAKHQRRTFWLYKGIGMLKLGRMHGQTGEKFVDPTAMSRQMRVVSDF